jgi:hypothetical protein
MESADQVLLDSLKNFYSVQKHADQLKDVLANPDNPISLRSLDWLITNYSKKRNISYMLPGDVRVFNIFTDYKSQLKSFSKRMFDCFKRRDRISFELPDGTCIESTIAQLNMFRWAIRYQVLEYCREHLRDIEMDMNRSMKPRDEKNGKRSQLSQAATQTCTTTPLRVRVTFD